MGFVAAVIEQMGIAVVREVVEKLLEEVGFVLPTVGPEDLMSRATVVGDKYADQIDKAAGRVPFHLPIRRTKSPKAEFPEGPELWGDRPLSP